MELHVVQRSQREKQTESKVKVVTKALSTVISTKTDYCSGGRVDNMIVDIWDGMVN